MKWKRVLAALLLWTMAALAMPVMLAAAAPAGDGSTYERRVWTLTDGAPQAADAIVQTDDGMLWIATSAGMYTFDGVRFVRVNEVYGHALSAVNLAGLRAIPGGLAVGYRFGGLSIFTRQGATHYATGKDIPGGTISHILADRDGVLYATTSYGVSRLVKGRWETVGEGSLPSQPSVSAGFDAEGTLWVLFNHSFLSNYTFYALPRGATRFHHAYAASDSGTSTVGGRQIAIVPHQQYMELSGSAPPQPLPMVDAKSYDDLLLEGPQGSVWTSREDGFVRLARRADGKLAPTEVFQRSPGAPRYTTTSLLDREDNLWVATVEGIERYRRHRTTLLDGGNDELHWLVAPGLGDELWYGPATGALVRVAADGSRRTVPDVRGIGVILRESATRAWVATNDALWEFNGATKRRWPLPDVRGWGTDVQAMAVDRNGQLLVSVLRDGLLRFNDGKWSRDERMRNLANNTPVTLLTTGDGRTWIGFTDSRLGELTTDGLRMLPKQAGLRIGNVLSLLDYRGRLLVGGDAGVAWIDGGRVRPVVPQRADSFRGVAAMAADAQGDLWLNGIDGLSHVTAAELARSWSGDTAPVAWERFDFQDGIRGGIQQVRPLQVLAGDRAGRIVYATVSQLGWLDPARIPRNRRAPDVVLQSLRAGGRDYAVRDGVQLPKLTRAVDIAFTATALSIPERVRLRYRLEGVDQDWRDVEHERAAHYTNLAPGNYRFRAIAANEDGAWNSTGAALDFYIEPAFWQTAWFRVLCGLAGVAVLALLFRWRLVAVMRRANERAAARLEERERIARSLHDTLLQSVQGLMLRFQAAMMRMPPDSPVLPELDKALVDADRMMENTRDEVMALRREPQGQELLDELCAAVATLAPGSDHLLAFELVGEPRPLRGEAAGEIFCVLREAAVNSVRHAQASRIVVELRFLPDAVEASVTDDGIGIDRKVAQAGRAGHFGIVGMRERIRFIGGRLGVTTPPGGGTAITLRVPARVAYARAERRRWWQRRG